MANYIVGDIQGCMASLQRLLAEVAWAPGRDTLWCVGDLVNRGPQSLAVLRWVAAQPSQVRVVLGNHDLHLLARAAGIAKAKPRDTLDDILQAHDRASLLQWLAAQPLVLHPTATSFMVHAGLHPQWTIAQAEAYAAEVSVALQHDTARFFQVTAGAADRWSDALTEGKRWRAILAFLVRVRTCFADGSVNPEFDGPLADVPRGVTPWFDFTNAAWATHHVYTGHWAALGVHRSPHHTALDSGCVWGRTLTALHLESQQCISVAACD